MPPILSFLLLIGGTYLYSSWQMRRLKAQLTGQEFPKEWQRNLFNYGALISIVLVINAVSYMKMREFDMTMMMYQEVVMPDGTIGEPTSSGLFIGQLEVVGGTLSLLALVWGTIQRKVETLNPKDQTSTLQVMAAVTQSLLAPFWLATLGIGSLFGISSGFGLRDIIRHAELIMGPPLIMALELTAIWAFLKFGVTRE
ncbi:MAG: hypothetical protein V1799_16515 [bacterium]